jgi:hypothetical protein
MDASVASITIPTHEPFLGFLHQEVALPFGIDFFGFKKEPFASVTTAVYLV